MRYGILIHEFEGKITSIENHSNTNYKFDFKEDDKLIYTVFVGEFMSITVPSEVFSKWNPVVIITKIN